MLLGLRGIHVERDVFAFLIELQLSRRRQALRQGGLAIKLVRELASFEHGLGMHAGSVRKPGIHSQRGRAGLLPRAVG